MRNDPIRIAAPLALVLALAGPARAAVPEDARLFIDHVIAAHGGWEKLERVKAYRVEGDLFAMRRHESAPTVRVSAGPERIKILIEYSDGHEARLLNGRKGWRAYGGGAFEPSGGPMYDAMVLQAARADVPWILHERAAEARRCEPFVHDSLSLPGIEIPLGEGLRLRVFVDPASWRVRVSQGLLSHGGMETHFETIYTDWRDVEGIPFAFREENWASGTFTGTTTIRRIVINPRLMNGEFTPPRADSTHRAVPGRSS